MKELLDRVVFVAVIHTDLESVEYARQAVREIKPEVVAVELDHERYQQLLNQKNGHEQPETPPTGNAVQDLLQHLAVLEKKLGEVTGSGVGEEMLVAIEEGRSIGAKIALVDRPIQMTMQAMAQVPLNEIYGLLNYVPETSKEIQSGSGEDLISMLKEEGAIENMLTDFESEFPALADALIHQRDLYVAKALKTILNDVDGKIVAVLGAGHIEGVKSALQNLLDTEAAS